MHQGLSLYSDHFGVSTHRSGAGALRSELRDFTEPSGTA